MKDAWGKEFDFDVEREYAIYRFLCRKKLKPKTKVAINGYQFKSYKNWKNCIRQKYEKWDIEQLIEFKKFLNIKARETQTLNIIENSLLFSTFSVVLGFYIGATFKDTNVISVLVWMVIFQIFAYLTYRPIIKQVMESSLQLDFFKDYKKIIKKLIHEKRSLK